MKRMNIWVGASIVLLAGPMLAGCQAEPTSAADRDVGTAVASLGGGGHAVSVSGSAVHFFTTAIVHSQEPTATGMIQRSTDIVQMSGDLSGYVVYHVTSEFDFAGETLVNTGTQLFSGTVLGSHPVLLHDDGFRFDADLATGEVLGHVRFSRSNDAPHRSGWFECELVVVGTGQTPEGDGLAEYTGECTRRGTLE